MRQCAKLPRMGMNPAPTVVAIQTRACRASLALFVLLAAGIAGCATTQPMPPAGYEDLAQRAMAGEMVSPRALRDALLAAPDFDKRLHEATRLERQVLALADEPLRLGAAGSAILDIYYASLAGHQALARFYGYVEAPEQVEWHERWVAAIRASIEADAGKALGGKAASSRAGQEGELAYPVLSSAEAEAFVVARGLSVVGSAYEVDGERFLLRLAARAEEQPMETVLFDLTALRSALLASAKADPDTRFPVPRPITCKDMGACGDFGVEALVRVLAVGGDSAAQTFIGSEMRRARRFDDTVGWLEQAARANNGLAQLILAEVFLERALRSPVGEGRTEWLEAAERRLLLAINAGFDTAMSHLGAMYLSGAFGEEKTARGAPLLVRAADLGNVDAMLNLAALHAFGEVVEKDDALAEQYFRRAAEKNERGKVEYARFLTRPEAEGALDHQAWRWLRDVAKNSDNPQAMLLVGNLYARGTHVDRRLRRAKTWLKRAAQADPDNPNLVNEVAWTLTVSHLPRLRDARYALEIMDRVMAEEGPARRTPAYLDTWAAAYAANGDFERAIAVQEEAIQMATSNRDPNNELPILRKHLDAFRAGVPINEVPWAPLDLGEQPTD